MKKFDVSICTKNPKDIYKTAISIGENIGLVQADEAKMKIIAMMNQNMYYNIDFNEGFT